MARTRGGRPSSDTMEEKSKNVQKKKEHLKDRMVVQGDFFNAQVSQYCYYEANMKMIRSKMTETQKQILRRESCLAAIALDHEHTFWCKQIIHSVLMRQLKPDEKSTQDNSIYFNFAGKKVKFGRREFAIITGLKLGDFDTAFGNYHAPHGPAPIVKYIKPLGSTEEATYDEVLKAYDRINSTYPDADVVSLTLLLLYTSINGLAKRTKIEDKILHLACDWPRFDALPWGELSYRQTIDSARRSMINALKQTSHPHLRTYTLGGFPPALGIFAYEVMPHLERLKMVQKVHIEGVKPRMFRWKAVNAQRREQERKQVWEKRTADGEKVVVTRIKATEEEEEHFLQWEDETEDEGANQSREEGDEGESSSFFVSYRKRPREEEVSRGEKRTKVRHEAGVEAHPRNVNDTQLLERLRQTEQELFDTREELNSLRADLDSKVNGLTIQLEQMSAKFEQLSSYVQKLIGKDASPPLASTSGGDSNEEGGPDSGPGGN